MTRLFDRVIKLLYGVDGIIIAGPTASGKSKLAIELALKHSNSLIINADSRQVYNQLQILCAHPGQEELSMTPHALYEYKDVGDEYSVAIWLADVAAAIDNVFPIIVGGTGLYIQALLEGVSEVPVRSSYDYSQARSSLNPNELMQLDRYQDLRRQERALQVFLATGKWPWEHKKVQKIHKNWHKIYVDRNDLDERISLRLNRDIDLMIEEVLHSDVEGTIMESAIGVKQIKSMTDKSAIIQDMFYKTRQYAKRQRTWFKKYFIADEYSR